jgi:O-antigen/teichoic acid export membrane protein
MAMVVVYWNTGSVLLGFLRGNADVGWYNAAIKIVMVLVVVPQLYNQAMVPSISALFVQSLPRLERLIAESLRLMALIVVPMMTGGMILAGKIIHFLYGDQYSPSVLTLRVLFVGVAIIYISFPLGSTALYSNRERLYMWAVAMGALVNVGVDILLIPRLGGSGAAVATVFGELVVFGLMYRAANQVVPVRVVTNLWRPALASFAMALVLVLSQKVAMGWQILFGGFVYLGAVTSLGGLEMEDLRIVTSMFQPSVVSRK